MRVVLDTNVFVTALIKPDGMAGRVFKEVVTKSENILVMTPSIVEELEATLKYPKVLKYLSLKGDQLELWLASLQMVAHEITPRFKYAPIVRADPKDDRYIVAAIEGKADCIISGDKHLLVMHPYQGIPIISPADFIKGEVLQNVK